MQGEFLWGLELVSIDLSIVPLSSIGFIVGIVSLPKLERLSLTSLRAHINFPPWVHGTNSGEIGRCALCLYFLPLVIKAPLDFKPVIFL